MFKQKVFNCIFTVKVNQSQNIYFLTVVEKTNAKIVQANRWRHKLETKKLFHLLFDAIILLQNGSKNRSLLKKNIKKGLFLIYFVKIDQNLDSYYQKETKKLKRAGKFKCSL